MQKTEHNTATFHRPLLRIYRHSLLCTGERREGEYLFKYQKEFQGGVYVCEVKLEQERGFQAAVH